MYKIKARTRQEKRDVRLRLTIGLCIGLAMIVLYITRSPTLVQVDRVLYDGFLRHLAQKDRSLGKQPSPTPALVDLDEKSLTLYGQWPWPRHLLAKLIQKLTLAGAAGIGLDILLAEEDRASPVNWRRSLKQSFGVEVGFEGLPEALTDNDKLLSNYMAEAPVVNGFFLHFTKENALPLPPDLRASMGVVEQNLPNAKPLRDLLLTAHGATLPLPILRAVAPIGSINVAADPDGIVRALPMVTQCEGRIHASLALRLLMRGLGVSTLILRSGPDGLQSLRVGKYNIPVSAQGLIHVAFRGPRNTYPYFSAADILDDKIPAEELRGRLFIVGTSTPGLLDIRATPLDPMYPGMEVHAAALDAILSQRFLEVPAWIPGAQVISIASVCLISALAFALAAPIIYLPLSMGLVLGSLWVSWAIFQQGYYFSPQYVMISVVALAISLLAVRFWQEIRQKRQLRQAFSRYLSPAMVDRVADCDTDIFAGEDRQVTLMFTDIRSFTTLSEGLLPEQVVSMLNRYFTPMTSIIRASEGTVDKFIGDAIMAFWNAPLNVDKHASKAVRSALAMHTALNTLNDDLEKSYGVRLAMGAGVHTGHVYVGNMGTSELLDYTCIGDTVNLASRLEGMCPIYGVGIVVSEDCARICCEDDPAFTLLHAEQKLLDMPEDAILFAPLDSIRVKGKHKPVHIFTPLIMPLRQGGTDFLYAFATAKTLYQRGNFDAAHAAFAALDGPSVLGEKICGIYAERCQELMRTPQEEWEGVWTFTKK